MGRVGYSGMEPERKSDSVEEGGTRRWKSRSADSRGPSRPLIARRRTEGGTRSLGRGVGPGKAHVPAEPTEVISDIVFLCYFILLTKEALLGNLLNDNIKLLPYPLMSFNGFIY